MKTMLKSLVWLAVAALAGCATQTRAPQPAPVEAAASRTTPVILVSIDAFRADYFQRGKTPTLAAIAADGVRAKAMQPSFPSLTFPNHYTLVTGLYPDHHGIVNNTMYDPKLGKFSLGRKQAVSDGRWWDEAEPLWVTADKAGLKTATMFWPGSGAKIRGWRPDHWRAFDDRVTATQRVDQVLAWLDLPAAERPSFITLYFDAVDHAGHAAGPDSRAVNKALVKVDNALARLVAGLRARGLYNHVNLIIVADHGMASAPAKNTILIDKLIDMANVHVVSMGIVAGFNPKRHHAAAVRAKLLVPHPHMRCWDKRHIPARFHYGSNPRVPQITCLADVGWRISDSVYLAKRKRPLSLGEHGYDNADPRMRALFVAHGPAFRRGVVVPEFPNVDVYPLMAHLLHLTPQPNDGNYAQVEDMLKPAAR